MRNNYVPTTLDQYLNESKTITLKRGYGEKKPVVVGSNAPIRNQILAYVAENQRVSKGDLKRFIAGLNEGSKNPNASAIMWLKRNSQFFVMESKAGQTFFKLSPVGQRLTSRFAPMGAPISLTEKKKETKKDKEDYDFIDTKKGYPRKGLNDSAEKDEEEVDESKKETKKDKEGFKKAVEVLRKKYKDFDEQLGEVKGKDKYKKEFEALKKKFGMNESAESTEEARKERIKAIIENIRAKRTQPLNEEEKPAEEADELSFDDLDLEGEDKGSEEKPEGEDLDLGDDSEEDSDVEKVEITEFIITVDNADEAIKELEELGIPAERAEDEDEEEGEEEKEEGEEEKEEGEEEKEEGEEEKEEGEEELEEAEEPEMGGLDLGGDEEKPEGEDLDLGDDEETDEEPAGEERIKVSVDHWEALKGWLEGKGIPDVAKMFGGEVEVEEGPEEGDEELADDELDLDGGEGEDDLSLDLEPDIEESAEGPLDGMGGPEDVMASPAETLGDKIADRIADKLLAKL